VTFPVIPKRKRKRIKGSFPVNPKLLYHVNQQLTEDAESEMQKIGHLSL